MSGFIQRAYRYPAWRPVEGLACAPRVSAGLRHPHQVTRNLCRACAPRVSAGIRHQEAVPLRLAEAV